MNFELSEDHQLLSNTLRRYFAESYTIEKRNALAYTAPYYCTDTWAELADLGVLGAFLTEEDGGFGGTAEDVSTVFEELGRGLCVEPMLGALLGLRLLAACGQHDLAQAIVAGGERVALAVFEPHVSCDLSHTEAVARRDGDSWHLSGRKSAIYGAPGADHVLVTARTSLGIGLFRVTAPTLIQAAMYDGGGVADLPMDAMPAECLSEDCATAIEDALDLGRIALCAEAVGTMEHLVEMTIEYLKQRTQFGRSIGTFQALQHRVVDMLVEVAQCRSITIAAIAAYGSPKQARTGSMAKNLIGRMGTMIAEEAIQMHGGIGMTWEYAGTHYAKRLVMIDHQLGDRHDHVQRMLRLSAVS